ncbi:MAG: flagellar filament capping protein FliD [Tepidisphaeraceae bacterium]
MTQLNSSQFLSQLGLSADPTDSKYTGKKLVSSDPLASAKGGIGVQFQQKINDLINPVDGLIPTESKTIDDQITTYQTRISDLNDMLDQKRTRLENQFNNLETVLAKLKTQQSSLSSIGSVSAA